MEDEMRISGLSHVGLYVRDLEGMTKFYQGILQLVESHRNEGRMVFLTADKEREDHEVVLVQGRDGDAKIVQQLSFRVPSVDDVLSYFREFKRLNVPIDSTVSH